jgi:hypothetical protein
MANAMQRATLVEIAIASGLLESVHLAKLASAVVV